MQIAAPLGWILEVALYMFEGWFGSLCGGFEQNTFLSLQHNTSFHLGEYGCWKMYMYSSLTRRSDASISLAPIDEFITPAKTLRLLTALTESLSKNFLKKYENLRQ